MFPPTTDCPSQVAVVTKMQPVRNNGCYDTIVRVQRFDRSFTLAGGINLPKIIICHGDDGLQYKQVIKGNDDMRQDAVMQQVFQMVNRWLSSDAAARERRLHVLTYKVVPLSNQSGVLEWCANTQPLGEYLVRSRNPKAAHERYAPNDWLASKCRDLHKSKHACEYLYHIHQPRLRGVYVPCMRMVHSTRVSSHTAHTRAPTPSCYVPLHAFHLITQMPNLTAQRWRS